MTAPVVICGAGPAGLTAALFLARQDIPVTVLERQPQVFEDPRAATFHPPTLEMLAECGITRSLHEQGLVAQKWQFRDRQEGLVAEFDLAVLHADTPFPYRLQCEQHKLVRMLLAALGDYPQATVRMGCDVTGVEQDEYGVTIGIAGSDPVRASYVLGADGGRSVVRKSQAIAFEGFTYDERFLVVTTDFDFATAGLAYTNYVSDPEEWAALFKVPGAGEPGIWRVVFPVPVDVPEAALLDPVSAQARLRAFLPRAEPYTILHVNLYQVHQRVAETFRRGRVLLAGDAAHVNNPLGGMGMNFGIHDAINLAGRLPAVLAGGDPADLDRYDRQRRHVARNFLQAMTISNKKTLEERDPVVRRANQDDLRAVVADPVRMREYLLRTSMIDGVKAAAAIA